MPYVTRDQDGHITALHAGPNGEAAECLAADDPELLAFVGDQVQPEEVRGALKASDLEMVRVIEDLINVLIDNGVLKLTDLPPAAQKKLTRRGRLRARLGGLGDMTPEADEVLLP